MKIKLSLKQRIARAFVLLALLLAGFFTLVGYIAVETIEVQVVDERLDKLIKHLIEHYGGTEEILLPPDIRFLVNDAIPQELRQVAPGEYELFLGDQEVRALVRTESGNRFAVIQEMTEFEQTEFVIFTALGVGFAGGLILAVLWGLATARRVITPVSKLAEEVERNASPAALLSLDSDDEIGVLARAFAKRTEELQQVLMRERLFTGDVSHELRTPLTVMLGAAEVLQAQLADRPAQLAVAERVRRVAAETSARVSALLLLSRSPELIDAPRIALHELIWSEVERYRFLLLGKPAECRTALSETVWVDAPPELVGIAVGNLLRNAFQHADKGSIFVSLTHGKLIIEDEGPGLPEEVRARLFERFVQGDAKSAQGTGLGLSIVKRVVEHIGWQIRYEATPVGGSRFILSFPSSLQAD